jgi:hypothetical protein
MSWLSICFTVSSPTPTMIRTAVPPNGKFWFWPLPVMPRKKFGSTAMTPRYSEPGRVMRREHEVQVLRGRPAGPDAGDEAAELLHLVGPLVGLNVMPT